MGRATSGRASPTAVISPRRRLGRTELQDAEPLAADDLAGLVGPGGDPGQEVARAQAGLLLVGDVLDDRRGGDDLAEVQVALDLELGVRGEGGGEAGVVQHGDRRRPGVGANREKKRHRGKRPGLGVLERDLENDVARVAATIDHLLEQIVEIAQEH